MTRLDAWYEPVTEKRRVVGQLLWFGLWVAITGIALWLHPAASGHATHLQLGLAPCPSALLLDRPCPGCGLTTSWTAFVHGNFGLAFRAHPLGPILYVLFMLSAILALRGFIRQERLVTTSVGANRFLVVTSLIFLAFGLIRMGLTPHYGAF